MSTHVTYNHAKPKEFPHGPLPLSPFESPPGTQTLGTIATLTGHAQVHSHHHVWFRLSFRHGHEDNARSLMLVLSTPLVRQPTAVYKTRGGANACTHCTHVTALRHSAPINGRRGTPPAPLFRRSVIERAWAVVVLYVSADAYTSICVHIYLRRFRGIVE